MSVFEIKALKSRPQPRPLQIHRSAPRSKTTLTRDFGPVEVKGLEPSPSALRMYDSRSLTRAFPRTFLVAAFRSPQVPSRSLAFHLGKDT